MVQAGLNDAAVIVAAVGYVYTNPTTGAPAPTPTALETLNPLSPSTWTAAGWNLIGHTARGTLPDFGYEGGKIELKGSWQVAQIREVEQDIPADYVKLVLNQFDQYNLGLYYGQDVSSTVGEFSYAGGPWVPNEQAFLTIIEDQSVRLGFYAARASIRRDAAIKLALGDFGELPIQCTFLKYNNTTPLYSWINELLFPAVGSAEYFT